jgi:hypothetical protein
MRGDARIVLLNLFANAGTKAFADASSTTCNAKDDSSTFAFADGGSSTGVADAYTGSDS